MKSYKFYLIGGLLVVLIAVSAVLGIKFGRLFFNKEIKSDTNSMEKVIGKTWDKYSIPVKQVPDMIFVTLVSDGVINQLPIEIKTKEGEKLATAVLSIKGSYYDNGGRRQQIVVPLLIQLTDGRVFHPSFPKPITWQGEELKQKIVSRAEMFGTVKGLIMKVGIILPGTKRILDKNTLTGDIHDDVYLVVEKYNSSWNNELENFVKTGNPKLGIIFSYSLVSSQTQEYADDN